MRRAAGISSWRKTRTPFPARAIQPVITINLPGVGVGGIRCEKEFAILSPDERGVRLSLSLGPDEFAIISLQ